ncbi:MAG: Smg protein [Alteromonadaceae bacterium]
MAVFNEKEIIMFDILMYLFENYIHSETEMRVDHNELTDELSRAGFHEIDIYKALSWLEKLANLQKSEDRPYATPGSQQSMRIYTADEMARLDVECRGFILFLERVEVLNFESREMVIDRVCELDEPLICLEDLKWVILMVLVNIPGHEQAYAQMEDLVFDEVDGPLH